MRGKVLFVVINTFTKQYLAQFPGLRGAIMFTSDIAPHDNSTVFLEPANENYTPDQVTAEVVMMSVILGRDTGCPPCHVAKPSHCCST
jgi:hypothetical protein